MLITLGFKINQIRELYNYVLVENIGRFYF